MSPRHHPLTERQFNSEWGVYIFLKNYSDSQLYEKKILKLKLATKKYSEAYYHPYSVMLIFWNKLCYKPIRKKKTKKKFFWCARKIFSIGISKNEKMNFYFFRQICSSGLTDHSVKISSRYLYYWKSYSHWKLKVYWKYIGM